ncbi:MAG TPA: glycosyl hydrolase family 17 protein [Chloroflexota bacterium]|nr:glycosyl hydrolase family 17 protein [Chloroflexota bacterium]
MTNATFLSGEAQACRRYPRRSGAWHRRLVRGISLEPLEERALLTGEAFAVIDGNLTASGNSTAVTIEVSKSDFTIPKSGRVVLELVGTDADGASLSIGAPIAVTKLAKVGRASAAGAGWRIASLGPGQFTFPISGGVAGAAFTVDFSLVGDVNGNGVVNRADIKAIRSRLGVSAKSRRFLPGADLIPNKRIGAADLRFALSDLNARTSLKPLSLVVGAIQPAYSPLAGVVVQAQPGASITLLERGASQTQLADSSGKASFEAGLLTGVNTFDVVATDSFGQRVNTTTSVTRTALSNYLEAAFQPYVGQWTGSPPSASVPLFNSYGAGNDSVASQISLVAPQFSSLATYSAGYAGYYSPTTPYNQVDSNWMVGGAAAAYNQSQGALKETVSQGIFQQLQPGSEAFNLPLMDAEANGAVSIAKAANAVYAGTVTRLIFTNEFVTDATTTNEVYDLINQPQGATPSFKDQAHGLGLEVGVRSNTFGQLTNPSSPYLVPLQNLVKSVDFIMLNLYPTNEHTETPQQAVADVAGQYNAILAAARALNPNIDVLIGETGWPSQGVSFNDIVNGQVSSQDNTVANEQAYFAAIQSWANQNQVETNWFEAIDEPWKSNQNNSNPLDPQGIDGAEGHYGLWTYNSNGPDGQFTEKFTPGP